MEFEGIFEFLEDFFNYWKKNPEKPLEEFPIKLREKMSSNSQSNCRSIPEGRPGKKLKVGFLVLIPGVMIKDL